MAVTLASACGADVVPSDDAGRVSCATVELISRCSASCYTCQDGTGPQADCYAGAIYCANHCGECR